MMFLEPVRFPGAQCLRILLVLGVSTFSPGSSHQPQAECTFRSQERIGSELWDTALQGNGYSSELNGDLSKS